MSVAPHTLVENLIALFENYIIHKSCMHSSTDGACAALVDVPGD